LREHGPELRERRRRRVVERPEDLLPVGNAQSDDHGLAAHGVHEHRASGVADEACELANVVVRNPAAGDDRRGAREVPCLVGVRVSGLSVDELLELAFWLALDVKP
jgi:hypothetical protein